MRRDEQIALGHITRQLGRQYDRKNHHGGWTGLLAKTSTNGIPARVGTTAGKGMVKLCLIQNDGELVETGTEMPVFNPFSEPIGSETYITVKVINGTQLVVDAEDCQ